MIASPDFLAQSAKNPTRAENAYVGLPSEEEIAKLVAEVITTSFREGVSDALIVHASIAKGVLDLIRPAFEAKELVAVEAHDDFRKLNRLAEGWKARTLSAEAKLAQAVEALKPLGAIADIFDQASANRPREGEIMSWTDHRCGERVLTVEMLQAARSASSAARGKTG